MSTGLLGCILALAVLVFLCVKKVHIVVSTLIAVFVVCIFNGMSFYSEITGDYIEGFVSFVQSWFLVFFAGAFFGEMMDKSGSAQAIANGLVRAFGEKYSLIAIPLAIGLLCYGGVNGFVVVFATWPMLDRVFRKLDLPRRLMPAWFQFGAGTFSNCGPGTPSSLNLVATGALGVGATAGWQIGLVTIAVTLILGIAWGMWMFKRAKARGEHYLSENAVDYSYEDQAKQNEERELPSFIVALIPLIVTVVSLNITVGGQQIFNNFYAIALGAFVCALLNLKRIGGIAKVVPGLGEGVKNALNIVAATSAITGFATVVKATTAFSLIVEAIPSMQGSPLLTLFLATNVMCAITGTATGAANMVAPILGDIYVKMGVPAATVARTIVVSAVGFDSVPHNGGIVNYIFGFAHEDYKSAYPAVFALSVVVPCIAALAAIAAAYLFGFA